MGNGGGRIAAFVFIALLCCSGAAAADLLELHARPVIAPAKQTVSVHDLFIVAEQAAGEGISIASAEALSPVCGAKAALVPLWQLKGVLDRSSNTVSLIGRRSIYIPHTTNSPAMQRLLEQLLHLLRQEYPAENERLEIEIPRMPGGLQALVRPEESVQRNIKTELLTLQVTGSAKALARFLVTAEELQGVVTVEVSRFTPYLSPTRAVDRGGILDSYELERRAYPVGAYPAALISEENGSYEIRAAVSPGEPITVRNARIKPVVEPGDNVSVVVKKGSVQLTLPGNVRGEAAMNETVAVRLDTGIIKECRVLGAGEVILE